MAKEVGIPWIQGYFDGVPAGGVGALSLSEGRECVVFDALKQMPRRHYFEHLVAAIRASDYL